jgi:hypothetical protein
MLDPPRPDSAATIQRAQELGVEVGFPGFSRGLGDACARPTLRPPAELMV